MADYRKMIGRIVTDAEGAVGGVSVTVKQTGTATLVTLKANKAGTEALANPFDTDANGVWAFFTDIELLSGVDYEVDIVFAKSGLDFSVMNEMYENIPLAGLVTDPGAVQEADFTAGTLLYATANATPVATTPTQFMAILSGQAAAAFDWGGQDLLNAGVMFLTEQASAEADVAGKGQIWVKTATPNTLWFTDDAGTDFQLGVGAISIVGTPVDNQLAVWKSASSVEGDTNLTWSGSQLDVTGNLYSDGANVLLDGSTSVRLVSANFIALRAPENRIGFDVDDYMQIALAETTGVTVITHTGSAPTVTWTANSFDFVGSMALDAVTLSDVLTFSDGATIDNTDANTLTITETNIALTGIVGITGATNIAGIVTIGVDDTGYDFKCFGATSGAYFLFDQANDCVVLQGGDTKQMELRFMEDTDNGSHYTAFKAHATMAAAITYILPAADSTGVQYLQSDGSGNLSWTTPAGAGDVSKVGTPVNDQVGVWTGDGTIEGTTAWTYDGSTKFRMTGSIFLLEQAAAIADEVAYGQIWVKNDTPNTLWFTDDAGTDFQLGVGGGGGGDVMADGSVPFTGAVSFGVDGAGVDATFFGVTASYKAWWDANGDTNGAWYFGADTKGVMVTLYGDTTGHTIVFDPSGDTNGSLLVGADTKGILFSLFGDVTGCGVFWDPSTDTNGTLSIGAAGGSKGVDFTCYGATNLSLMTWDQSANALLLDGSTLFIKEQAAAQADVEAYGQIWTKTATPNELYFTDDAGTDTKLVSLLHTDISGEIVAITEKTAATGADEILIEDSAAANAKKSVKLSNLSGMSGCRVRAYCSAALSAKRITWVRVPLQSEDFDSGNDFNSTGVTGTADATEANKLHDADAGFTAALVGACVHNTTDDTYAIVTAYVDSGELTISADIMADTETYVVYPSFFTAPENGYYSVRFAVALGPGADAGTDLHVVLRRYRSSTAVDIDYAFVTGANAGGFIGWPCADLVYLETGDLLWMSIYHTSASNVNIAATAKYTFMSISLESRP